MSFNFKYFDATSVECDAIINSLGRKSNVYGELCSSIIKKASTKELESKIHEFSFQAKFLEILDTKGYKLPAKHILSILAPFEYQDDTNYSLYEKTYMKILVYCYKHNYKNVYLPIIGTGVNGYKNHYLIDVILYNLCFKFCSLYKDMNITLMKSKKVSASFKLDISSLKDYSYSDFDTSILNFTYDVDEKVYKERIESRDKKGNYPNYYKSIEMAIASYQLGEKNNAKELYSLLSPRVNFTSVKVDLTKLKAESSPIDYLDLYLYERFGLNYVLKNQASFDYHLRYYLGNLDSFVGRKVLNKLKGKRLGIDESFFSNDVIYKIGFAFQMTLEEINDLLALTNKSFNPLNKRDSLIKEFFIRHNYDIDQIDNTLNDNKVNVLF